MMKHKERIALINKPFPRIRIFTTSYPNGGVQISRQGMGIDSPRSRRAGGDPGLGDVTHRENDGDPEELYCAQDRRK